jgi:hypothetical protein
LVEPVHDYGRSVGGSITGGAIYRGAALDPAYAGRYFYADFISGRVFSLGLHLDDRGEARADDEREHTAALGGQARLGMVSSFGYDHDGELLLLNYTAGTVVRVVPDFAVVPEAPTGLDVAFAGTRATLSWTSPSGSVAATAYTVERVRAGRVEERLDVERREATLDAAAGDCFRVRARASNGATGPASSQRCVTEP